MKKYSIEFYLKGSDSSNIINVFSTGENDVNWQILQYLEFQYGAIFTIETIKHFVQEECVNHLGEIYLSFDNYDNKECLCIITEVKEVVEQ